MRERRSRSAPRRRWWTRSRGCTRATGSPRRSTSPGSRPPRACWVCWGRAPRARAGLQRAPPPRSNAAPRGGRSALRHLPSGIADRLSRPPEEIIHRWGALPRTLCHGDAKVANFAILPDGRVAAFDCGCMAAAPAALDRGWYLAVNATRILGSKESFAARYRGRLEAALERPLPEDTWTAIVDAAIEAGAMLLLWSKALALERDDPAARAEWNWWVEQLGRN